MSVVAIRGLMSMEDKYRPSEPMIVYDIERLPNGGVRVSSPYLLRPDSSVAALTASLK
jgi:hypothetical protein